MERFVRNTKIAMEKLHKENEALRAQVTSPSYPRSTAS